MHVFQMYDEMSVARQILLNNKRFNLVALVFYFIGSSIILFTIDPGNR